MSFRKYVPFFLSLSTKSNTERENFLFPITFSSTKQLKNRLIFYYLSFLLLSFLSLSFLNSSLICLMIFKLPLPSWLFYIVIIEVHCTLLPILSTTNRRSIWTLTIKLFDKNVVMVSWSSLLAPVDQTTVQFTKVVFP